MILPLEVHMQYKLQSRFMQRMWNLRGALLSLLLLPGGLVSLGVLSLCRAGMGRPRRLKPLEEACAWADGEASLATTSPLL